MATTSQGLGPEACTACLGGDQKSEPAKLAVMELLSFSGKLYLGPHLAQPVAEKEGSEGP